MCSGEFAALDIALRRSTGEPEMFIIRTGRLGLVEDAMAGVSLPDDSR
jgi:hypothetical protein